MEQPVDVYLCDAFQNLAGSWSSVVRVNGKNFVGLLLFGFPPKVDPLSWGQRVLRLNFPCNSSPKMCPNSNQAKPELSVWLRAHEYPPPPFMFPVKETKSVLRGGAVAQEVKFMFYHSSLAGWTSGARGGKLCARTTV